VAKYKEKEKERGGVATAKPRNDAYTLMLLVTLLAIIAGCVLLYLEWDEYGQKSPPKDMMPDLGRLGTGAPAATTGGGGAPPTNTPGN